MTVMKIMAKLSVSLIFTVAFGAVFATQVRYDDHKMYRITPESEMHVAILKKLKSPGVTFMVELTHHLNREYHVLFAPHEQGKTLDDLLKTGMSIEEIISDVQKLIDEQTYNSEPRNDGRLDWDRYNRLNVIFDFLERQAEQHPSFVTTFNIGTTYENRNLTAIKLSKSGETKPAIWVDSNIHSREWITGALGTYLIDQLVNSDDAEINTWLDDYDWYILPIANPDGFEYTFTHDRFWRKTRSNTTSPLGCKGVDPNRNFDFKFDEEGGSSPDPCSMTYRGRAVFSEPETKAMADFIATISDRLVFYLSLHSSGQYILIPTGFNSDPIPQYNTYMRIGQLAADAHRQRYNTEFRPGNIVELLYRATGCSMDFVKDKFKTNLTFTYELRDKGQYGHLLPPDQILPSALEFMDGFRVIMQELAKGIPESDDLNSALQ